MANRVLINITIDREEHKNVTVDYLSTVECKHLVINHPGEVEIRDIVRNLNINPHIQDLKMDCDEYNINDITPLFSKNLREFTVDVDVEDMSDETLQAIENSNFSYLCLGANGNGIEKFGGRVSYHIDDEYQPKIIKKNFMRVINALNDEFRD